MCQENLHVYMGSIAPLPLTGEEHGWLARKSQDADVRHVKQSQTALVESLV